ncbi:ATP-binding protein [Bradyrhizobium forestalis]|uniref:ATP-binding protein n=1 Tax=Bradyrhizobium forestalis TaxID=1419263 RepID=UPI003D319DB6
MTAGWARAPICSCSGPPGGGKSHLAAAIGLAIIENGWRVLFTRTTDLVQKLQLARRELNLEAAIKRLDSPPAEIKSERWATSSRNPRATSHRCTHGRLRRNPQPVAAGPAMKKTDQPLIG